MKNTLLFSSSSLPGILKMISEYCCDDPANYQIREHGHVFNISRDNYIAGVRVVRSGGRYRFERRGQGS